MPNHPMMNYCCDCRFYVAATRLDPFNRCHHDAAPRDAVTGEFPLAVTMRSKLRHQPHAGFAEPRRPCLKLMPIDPPPDPFTALAQAVARLFRRRG